MPSWRLILWKPVLSGRGAGWLRAPWRAGAVVDTWGRVWWDKHLAPAVDPDQHALEVHRRQAALLDLLYPGRSSRGWQAAMAVAGGPMPPHRWREHVLGPVLRAREIWVVIDAFGPRYRSLILAYGEDNARHWGARLLGRPEDSVLVKKITFAQRGEGC